MVKVSFRVGANRALCAKDRRPRRAAEQLFPPLQLEARLGSQSINYPRSVASKCPARQRKLKVEAGEPALPL